MNLLYDQTGIEHGYTFKINYSYFIPTSNDNQKLAIGIGFSANNQTIDFSQAILNQPNDPLITSFSRESGLMLDLDLGLLYQKYKKIYLGISATNLMKSSTEIGNVTINHSRYYYATGGFYCKLSGTATKKIYLVPSFLIKSDLLNWQAEGNLRLDINNLWWLGCSYRFQDAVAANIGVDFKGFMIGAAYDLSIGKLNGTNRGTAELFLGYSYSFGSGLRKVNNFNTRYL